MIDGLPDELIGGIYWGYAQVQNGPVYGMVMSIGNILTCNLYLIYLQECRSKGNPAEGGRKNIKTLWEGEKYDLKTIFISFFFFKGWNPFYNNTKRAMETHILHKFEPSDLYGQHLRYTFCSQFYYIFATVN